MNILEIKNLSVHFYTDTGTVRAIDKASLSIKKGEIMGLVGESGCGKTTMARTILRVLPQPSGRVVGGDIFFNGKNLLELSETEMNAHVRGRKITVIPQDPYSSFNPVFTVRTHFMDIMKHNEREKGRKNGREKGLFRRLFPSPARDIKKEIIEMLRKVQISSPESQLYKYPHEFSGGQRQRIMFAIALSSQPNLIIADEPTTALDVTIAAQVLVLLRDLTKQFNTSALFITHDMGVAHEICDTITVMYAGQIMESAPANIFFKKPRHPYTKGLLDSLPNPEGKIHCIEGEIPLLINPPTGCRFHPRCSRALPKCAEEQPDLIKISTDHFIRCFNPISYQGRATSKALNGS